MRFDKFTIKSQELIQNAQSLASRHGNQQIEPEHLMHCMLDEKEGALAFNSARLIVFLATGAAKAATLKTVLGDAFQPELFPAQRIRPQEGKVIWLVDEAAGSQISQEN